MIFSALARIFPSEYYRLVTQTAKQYAPEIATALNKAIAVVDAIGDLSQKISEKKRNTKALLEHFAIAQEPTLIQNCKEIADDSKALQDSLEKTIELVKSGKIKAKLADLQAACVKNVAFMNKLAPALAQCQGLSEPNLRDPKSCGPCADPWDMMPTNIVFVCNEAMNKVFGVESTSLLLPPDGDDNPQTENTSPQVATKSLFFEVQTGCDTDEKLTHVYTTTNSLGERFEYTACKLGDVTYFHYKGGEYWYYKGQYYKSNDHYNQTKQRIEQGFEMYNWSTRTYDYVNLPIGKLTLEQLADALGEFYYSTFGGMAGAEAGLVLDVLNNVYIQTDLSCRGTSGDSYRSCLVSNAPKEFAKMVALGTLAVGVYKSANFIWNKSVNILKLGSGGALNLVEKFKSLNTSKVRPPAFENKAYAEFLDDFAGNIKDFEGSGLEEVGDDLFGIFKTFTKEQLESLNPVIDKAINTINKRGIKNTFVDLSKTDDAIKKINDGSLFTTGDLVELPARSYLKNAITINEDILLNIELRCYDASGNTVGGSMREMDALKFNKITSKIENGITMKFDESQVAKGVSADRTTLNIFNDLPDNGMNLQNYAASKLGLNANQIAKLDNAKIVFTELSTGAIKSLAPSEFKKYFNSNTNFSSFQVDGLTPNTLGISKLELLQGALELIRKKL